MHSRAADFRKALKEPSCVTCFTKRQWHTQRLGPAHVGLFVWQGQTDFQQSGWPLPTRGFPTQNTYRSSRMTSRYCCPILTKTGTCRHILVKRSIIFPKIRSPVLEKWRAHKHCKANTYILRLRRKRTKDRWVGRRKKTKRKYLWC
jgi:hypothetical protein